MRKHGRDLSGTVGILQPQNMDKNRPCSVLSYFHRSEICTRTNVQSMAKQELGHVYIFTNESFRDVWVKIVKRDILV